MQSLSRCCFLLALSLLACNSPDPPANGASDPIGMESSRTTPPMETGRSIASIPPPSETTFTKPLKAQSVIQIDGSSTVFPITEAVAALFEKSQSQTRVQLGVSGTGGGFKRLCRGEIDIADASRPIKRSEHRLCQERGIDFLELPVAFDGISVVVHADNHWCRCLTLDELTTLWAPQAEGKITSWSQLRPEWPDRPLELFAPGADSGTFDYFTRAVLSLEGESRRDFIASEDDYLLAQGVADAVDALGFFGYAYYREYRQDLSLVAIDQGAGCVAPSERTIAEGTYRPLSRPVFIYVRAQSLERDEVSRFVQLYLEKASELVARVGYVPLPERAYRLNRERVESRRLGTLFNGGSQVDMSIEELLAIEGGRGLD